MYTNSQHDILHSTNGKQADETAVRSMYERAPYPGLGAGLKDVSLYMSQIEDELRQRPRVRYLEAGCGTGHYVVGVAKAYPAWECYGLDLSGASLQVATELAKRHQARVTLAQGSYMDDLPFDDGFDVVSAMGTIHHAADPVGAMRNLRRVLFEDGFLLLHLYGLRIDKEKFDIKEILNIFEPDLSKVEERFGIYKALMEHRRKSWLKHLLVTPPIKVYGEVRSAVLNMFRRHRGEVWSPPFTARFDSPTAPWVDHFCHPCERAYEVPDVMQLVEDSGFRIEKNLGQGREYPQLIPDAWRPAYDGLPDAAKWRLSELLTFGGGSFRLILRPV